MVVVVVGGRVGWDHVDKAAAEPQTANAAIRRYCTVNSSEEANFPNWGSPAGAADAADCSITFLHLLSGCAKCSKSVSLLMQLVQLRAAVRSFSSSAKDL